MSDIVHWLRETAQRALNYRSQRRLKEAASTIERYHAAIEKIAFGEGYYGAQAREYKIIAAGALSACSPVSKTTIEGRRDPPNTSGGAQ